MSRSPPAEEALSLGSGLEWTKHHLNPTETDRTPPSPTFLQIGRGHGQAAAGKAEGSGMNPGILAACNQNSLL